jgi:hypothetical protein
MFQRHKLENEEGKAYNASGVSIGSTVMRLLRIHNSLQVSPKMNALTARFNKLHGVSSLVNLLAVAAMTSTLCGSERMA